MPREQTFSIVGRPLTQARHAKILTLAGSLRRHRFFQRGLNGSPLELSTSSFDSTRQWAIWYALFTVNSPRLFPIQISLSSGRLQLRGIFSIASASKGRKVDLIISVLHHFVAKSMREDTIGKIGRLVGGEKSVILNQSQVKQFINEVIILSQVHHRKCGKLVGMLFGDSSTSVSV